MSLWGFFGDNFQNESISPISPISPKLFSGGNCGDIGDIGDINPNLKNASSLPPMKAATGGGEVPDYAAWCPRYYRGCFECPDYLPDKLRFCRAWNRSFHGMDVVTVAMVGEEGAEGKPSRLPEPTMPESDTGRGWWTYGRKKAEASTV